MMSAKLSEMPSEMLWPRACSVRSCASVMPSEVCARMPLHAVGEAVGEAAGNVVGDAVVEGVCAPLRFEGALEDAPACRCMPSEMLSAKLPEMPSEIHVA